MQHRNVSLDALRGFAILTMILSGSIAYGDVLPAWMYHAQVPPPHHKFIPTLAGITWVDLVFPFFLFTMGAAIPLSLQKNIKTGSNFLAIVFIAARRYVLLTFFALFTHHMMAWSISSTPDSAAYLLSITAFVLVFFQLYDNKNEKYKKWFAVIKYFAYVIALAFLFYLPFKDGRGFNFYNSDIIIIVLGNMAFFGTVIWWLTKNNPLLRIGLLPFIMAVFLAAKEPAGSWTKDFFNFNQVLNFKIDWMYKFYFVKYLFIIIPGTFAGEWLLQYSKPLTTAAGNNNTHIKIIGLLFLLLIVSNVILLFNRQLLLNAVITSFFLGLIFLLIKKIEKNNYPVLYIFFRAGAYLLLLGLFFEAYEGGIKKDGSTYSYYFVTSGVAFFMLIIFYSMSLTRMGAAINYYLSLNGRNPMVAYVAGNLLLMPLLHISGSIIFLESMNTNAWMGFLKGVLFTGLVCGTSIFFSKRKWFWKT